MVDVGEKAVTKREATAEAAVHTRRDVVEAILHGEVEKGDVLAAARIAGIMAVKRTPDLIPLCHPIGVTNAEVSVECCDDSVRATATVRTTDRTGVEMEALAAVAVAGLTVIDMIKSRDPAAQITGVRLVEKSGGKSGHWIRDVDA